MRPPRTSPIIADPTFLPPAETPDGRWHLFAHSIWGVHHFVSDDGVGWAPEGVAVRHAMRAFLHRDGGTYHLFYPCARSPMRCCRPATPRTSATCAKWA